MRSISINQNLRLEAIHQGMSQEMFELTMKNKPYLEPWMPWASMNTSITNTEDFIKSGMLLEAESDGLVFAIIYEDKIAGTIGLHKIDRLNKQTSIGYWITEELQGKGIVTKCVTKVIDIAFSEFGVNRIEVKCSVSNKKSRDIPERLGFRLDGFLYEGELVNKKFRDMAVYSITASEWKQKGLIKNNLLYAAPVMPSSDLSATKNFFIKTGLFDIKEHKDYLIMCLNDIELHYFKYKVDPMTNYSGCYIRTLRIDETYELFLKHGMIHPNGKLKLQPWGLKEFAVTDPDNNLLKFGERIR